MDRLKNAQRGVKDIRKKQERVNRMLLRCMINGEQVEKETEPTKRLLDFLREDCGLTGV